MFKNPMQKFASTIVLSVIVLTHAAFAADLPRDEPLIPQAPVAEAIDTSEWGGFYVGIYGGYTWLQAEAVPNAEGDDDGVKIGGYTGYNWQFDNRVVTGFEAQGAYVDANAQTGGVSVDQEWDASLRARLGYAFENSLLYSFAGLAVTGAEARTITGSDQNTLTGFDIGAGLEFEIFEDVTARIEYDYDRYSDEAFALGGAGNTDVELESHNVNVGVGLKF
ncbi:MAG: outer membrane beta-barrel protein [Rhizobiaceae bacterium]|nr:outer membrane beta-barrel protein [Rhizobiaceae bacterium]